MYLNPYINLAPTRILLNVIDIMKCVGGWARWVGSDRAASAGGAGGAGGASDACDLSGGAGGARAGRGSGGGGGAPLRPPTRPISTRPPTPPAHPSTHTYAIGWTHTLRNRCMLLIAINLNLLECVTERNAQCANIFNVTKLLLT